MIFTGHTASGGDMTLLRIGIDGISQATPLDTFKRPCAPGTPLSNYAVPDIQRRAGWRGLAVG